MVELDAPLHAVVVLAHAVIHNRLVNIKSPLRSKRGAEPALLTRSVSERVVAVSTLLRLRPLLVANLALLEVLLSQFSVAHLLSLSVGLQLLQLFKVNVLGLSLLLG